MVKARILALFLASLLAACAAPTTQRPEVDSAAAKAERFEQTKLAVKQRLDYEVRAERVMTRLDIAAVDLCHGKTIRVADFITLQRQMPLPDEDKAFDALFPGNGGRLFVAAIDPGSRVDKSGLQVGDKIVRINETDLTAELTTNRRDLGYAFKEADSVSLVVDRAGKDIKLKVPSVLACEVPVHLIDKRDLNAYTDGTSINVFQGMMDFIKTDEELAMVLGHELGHVVRLHIEAKKHNATVGQVFGVLIGAAVAATTGVNAMDSFAQLGAGIGAQKYSVDFEAEADYVGLYIMARAGYPIDHAADFWRRMAVANPKAITMTTDHPATADRFVALEAAEKEIRAKQDSGQPLVPNEAKAADTAASPPPSIIQQR